MENQIKCRSELAVVMQIADKKNPESLSPINWPTLRLSECSSDVFSDHLHGA